jgi:hypothetical protein
VDAATAASQNGVFISQNMCYVVILFNMCSLIKDESYEKCSVFVKFWIRFVFYEEKAC